MTELSSPADHESGDAAWTGGLLNGTSNMPIAQGDVRRATRLISWGLRPKARPQQHPEYHELVERYLQDAIFRQAVEVAAGGCGLRVLYCGAHGVVLLANEDSPFLLKPSDFRGNLAVEQRMLDGLIELAIIATVYPRPADMFEAYDTGRSPITVAHVQETLDLIADRLRDAAKGDRDPNASAEAQGLLEAWRVYDARPRVAEGKSGRALHHTIAQQITLHLNTLVDLGCFVPDVRGGVDYWRSTVRYHLLVQEYAYSPIHDAVERLNALLSRSEATVGAGS